MRPDAMMMIEMIMNEANLVFKTEDVLTDSWGACALRGQPEWHTCLLLKKRTFMQKVI